MRGVRFGIGCGDRRGLAWIAGAGKVFLQKAAVSSLVTFAVQNAGGAVQAFERYPLDERCGNAAVAITAYMRDLFWPVDLAFFYPHPGTGISPAAAWGALGAIVILTALAAAAVRRQPWWLAGWLWFLGTLAPMIGVVQVGAQARADRYTYLPHIGLLLALVWGATAALDRQVGPPRRGVRPDKSTDLSARGPCLKTILTALAMALVLGLALLSRRQTETWRDSETLFRHALARQEANAVAHGNLGSWLATQGRADEARRHLERSLEIQPRFNEARFNLGNLDLQQGRNAEALVHYRALAGDFPRHVQALNNAAWLLVSAPDADPEQAREALALVRRAVAASRAPAASVLDTLALALAATGDFPAAIAAGEQAKSRAEEEGRADLARAIAGRLAGWRQKTP